MTQLFTIENDKIVIAKLALTETQGNVTHTGNLTVTDTLTVENLHVKNLQTENGSSLDAGKWVVNAEDEINGKGFNWTWGHGSYDLQYRDGGRIWSNADFDLDINKAYKIDNVPVIMAGSLGPTITKSNLRQIGQLNNLTVLGDAEVGQFAFFVSSVGRIGINTQTPNGAIGIVENNVEFVAGSANVGSADVGTYTNHDLNIITDNIPRIIVKNTGDVTVQGNVKINGSLTVEHVISDTRVDRTSPLEFKATRDTSIHGKGLIWTGTGPTRQFIMMGNPDRLWSSESLDLSSGQSYYINGQVVLSNNGLGDSVTSSKLTKLGDLEALTVTGESRFVGDIRADAGTTTLKNAVFNNGINQLNISCIGLNASGNVAVTLGQDDEVFYADKNEIILGNRNNTRRPVKIYGPISIGVNNPDPDFDITIKGNLSFANKKFITGSQAPAQGTFNKGDICWNDNPKSDSYIGWVCVAEGAPGIWMPFGSIARQ